MQTDHLAVIYARLVYVLVEVFVFFFLSFFLLLRFLFFPTFVVIIAAVVMTARRCCFIFFFLLSLPISRYTSSIRSRKNKRRRRVKEIWNCTVTGTNPLCFLRHANGRIFVFRIFASFSPSVTKDKCLFSTSKLSKTKRRKKERKKEVISLIAQTKFNHQPILELNIDIFFLCFFAVSLLTTRNLQWVREKRRQSIERIFSNLILGFFSSSYF